MYTIRSNQSPSTSGAYRVQNTAVYTLHARRQYELHAHPPEQLSLLTVVSLGLIVMSIVVAILAVALL